MNRELKFRAWDTYESKWRYFKIGESFEQLGEWLYQSLCLDGSIFYQFTGLLDKNGKEIYEGDIVNLQPDQDDKIWHRIIEYDTAAFHCRAIHTSANHPLHFHKFSPDRKWVVIGNIYEHPELLKP